MKREPIILMTEDRLATLEEVRSATLSSADQLLQFCRPQGNYCETNSDRGGIVRYSAEEFEFFAVLSELDEGVAN